MFATVKSVTDAWEARQQKASQRLQEQLRGIGEGAFLQALNNSVAFQAAVEAEAVKHGTGLPAFQAAITETGDAVAAGGA